MTNIDICVMLHNMRPKSRSHAGRAKKIAGVYVEGRTDTYIQIWNT